VERGRRCENPDLTSAGSLRRACLTHSARAPLEISSWPRPSRHPTCHWACQQTSRLSQGQFEFRKSDREQGPSVRAPGGLFFLWISRGAFWRRTFEKATLNWRRPAQQLQPCLHPYRLERETSGPGGSLFARAWVSLNKLRETLRVSRGLLLLALCRNDTGQEHGQDAVVRAAQHFEHNVLSGF
jgi:hypothetical protein